MPVSHLWPLDLTICPVAYLPRIQFDDVDDDQLDPFDVVAVECAKRIVAFSPVPFETLHETLSENLDLELVFGLVQTPKSLETTTTKAEMTAL